MRRFRLATVVIAALVCGAASTAGAGDYRPRLGPVPLQTRTCLNPKTAPLKLAQNVILCCCIEAATKGQCCNYVNATVCTPQVPGCGC